MYKSCIPPHTIGPRECVVSSNPAGHKTSPWKKDPLALMSISPKTSVKWLDLTWEHQQIHPLAPANGWRSIVSAGKLAPPVIGNREQSSQIGHRSEKSLSVLKLAKKKKKKTPYGLREKKNNRTMVAWGNWLGRYMRELSGNLEILYCDGL